MFGLFKKNLSDEQLIEILSINIIEFQKYLTSGLSKAIENTKILDSDKGKSNDSIRLFLSLKKINHESLFYSIQLFTKFFPNNDIIKRAIGGSLEKEFGKMDSDTFHKWAKKSVDRTILYSSIYKDFDGNPMVSCNQIQYIFLGDEMYEGTDKDEIPFYIIDAQDALKIDSFLLSSMKVGTKLFKDVKANLKNSYKFNYAIIE